MSFDVTLCQDMETRLIDAEEKREDYHRRYSETDRLTLVAQQVILIKHH